MWEWDGDSWVVAAAHRSTAPTARWSATSTATTSTTCSGTPPARAADYYWYGNTNGSLHHRRARTINGTYTPLVGDLDGNGGDDVFWYAQRERATTPSGTRPCTRGTYSSRATTVNGTYRPFTGDFDGNGTDDLFWYAPGSAADSSGTRTAPRASTRSVARTRHRQLRAGRRRLQRQRHRRHRVVLAELRERRPGVAGHAAAARAYSVSSVHSG